MPSGNATQDEAEIFVGKQASKTKDSASDFDLFFDSTLVCYGNAAQGKAEVVGKRTHSSKSKHPAFDT